MPWRRTLAVAILLAVPSLAAATGGDDVRLAAATSGVVVEEVARESSAGRAGIEPGDVIQSWSRASGLPVDSRPGSGRIESPFDLTAVEVEEAPRGAVTLVGRRGASESAWTLPPGRWGVTVRPALRGELLVLYEEGRRRIAAQEVEAGVAQWRNAAHRAQAVNGGDRWLEVWFSSRAGRALAGLQRWPEADTAYGEAVAQAEKDREGATAAQLLREWGQVFEKRSEWDRAEDCFRRALAFDQELDAASLTRAFQYAGARSIVASLWSVSDVSTAELMKGFYGHLKAGKSKDEALRAAQIALIGKPAPPFAWAPFELIGDWQ